jgi:urate oxidase
MAIVLGPNQYGKAENRVVRIYRDTGRHEIRDVNVSTALRGRFAAAHTDGDQRNVLPTDSQKNTCYAYAKEKGIGQIEDYALDLARHFVDDIEPVDGARVVVEEYRWERISVAEAEHPHAFVRSGQEVRTTQVTVEGTGDEQRLWVVSGLKDLTLLKSTGSEFHGFLRDGYTTLAETDDRIMATSLVARWRYTGADTESSGSGTSISRDWDKAYADIRQVLLARFAELHSLALQQTLWEMGRAVLEAHPEVAEVMFSAPNKHHFVVDLAPFGLENPNEVFHADDRPYGLIECNVTRESADGTVPDAGPAWQAIAGLS